MTDEGSAVEVVAAETPPAALVPTAPKSLAEQGRSELQGQARELVAQVRSAPEDRSLARRLAGLGSEAQQRSGLEIELLKTKVGTLLKDLDGPGARIPQGLLELRKTMDRINPHAMMKQRKGFLSRLLRRTPVIGDALADIATRYESVQTQIDSIINSLRMGKDELLQDSIELERLYSQVQEAQLDLQKSAYLGELVWQELDDQLGKESGDADQQRLQTIVHRVAMRVQDLRTMEQVNTQFFVSIDITIQNNDHLSDAITRTVTVTRSLLTVGLTIQAALANQKRILGAVQETQKYTADMLAANAEALRQQTAEIGDLYKNPVLALDKVKHAYDELMGAMNDLDEIRRVGTESARNGVAQLNEMTAKLAPKAEAMRAARQFESDSQGAEEPAAPDAETEAK